MADNEGLMVSVGYPEPAQHKGLRRALEKRTRSFVETGINPAEPNWRDVLLLEFRPRLPARVAALVRRALPARFKR